MKKKPCEKKVPQCSLPSAKLAGAALANLKIPSKRMNVAVVIFDEKRYPLEPGHDAINTKSEMVVLVLQGRVMLYIKGKKVGDYKRGDTVHVPRNVPYHWIRVSGKASFYVVSSLPWKKEDRRLVPSR